MLYPNLLPSAGDDPHYSKYGHPLLIYLREHHEGLLLLSGKLNAHLNEIDETAHARMKPLTKQMSATQGVIEDLKAAGQMAWVGAMENVRNAAEEIILSELIYA